MDTQTPSIPFKTLPGPNAWKVLGNSTIGEINVPKYGSITYGEWVRYYDGLAAIDRDFDLTDSQKATKVRGLQASLILRRIEPNWNPESIGEAWQARAGDGEVSPIQVSDLLVTELSKFFLGELNRWVPTGYVLLVEHQLIDDAERLARSEAEQKGLVVMTRSDLRLSGMFVLFRRADQPKGGTPKWELVADYSRDEDFEDDSQGESTKK